MKRSILLVVWCLSTLVASAHAQTLTGRSSTLNYDYVYGAGGDTHADGDLVADNALLAGDIEGAGFSGWTSGVLPNGQAYYAGVFSDLDLQYTVNGPLALFQSIHAGATSAVAASTSGAGSAVMLASNPGNGLILNFTIDNPTTFRLTGSISHPNPMAFSFVALQYFDGIVWQNGIFNSSIHLPGGVGPFDISGTLAPGLYRMNSALALNAQPNQQLAAAYSYQLTVPEPATLSIMLLGLLVAARRRGSTVRLVQD